MSSIRTGTLALTAVLVVVTALLASGCGGDAGKARGYVEQGNELIAAVEKQGEELGALMDSAFSDLYKEISSGSKPDVVSFASAAADMESLADDMITRARKAKAAFERVDTLEDVPGYVKYADLKIRIIDSNIKGLEELKAFLKEAGEKLAASDFDLMAFQSFVTQYGESVKTLGEEGGKLQEQAEALWKSEKL